MKTVKIQLEELTCPSCIKKIEGTLRKQNGVSEATVLFNSSKVKVLFDGEIVSKDQIIQVIQQLGYIVVKAKAS